jgi:hypothetical protein
MVAQSHSVGFLRTESWKRISRIVQMTSEPWDGGKVLALREENDRKRDAALTVGIVSFVPSAISKRTDKMAAIGSPARVGVPSHVGERARRGSWTHPMKGSSYCILTLDKTVPTSSRL